jgi:Holliday junction resolvase RusA-like endonuclease
MSENNGKRAIDKLIALTPTERRKLHVPELNADIFFRPMTKAEMDAAIPNDDVKRPQSTTGLFLLVHMAEYEDGSKVFKRTDIDNLRMRARLDIVNRLESFMWDTQVPEIKEAEKEIEADPTSASA